MISKTQIMKGILEGCVLAVLEKEKLYSQEIPKKLAVFGMTDVSDGTLFPLLLRLESDGLIESEKVPVPNGPARKYYMTTEKGGEELKKFSEIWRNIDNSVNKILIGGETDE
ncbi:MAG: PadR family transcriptional regulator [Oscillospiraceae bacterium]|nr:PadR family transcriptional regulator [Oscillospiraceae bacterium]